MSKTPQVTTTDERAAHPALAWFHESVRAWFAASFEAPTRAQELAWPLIAEGQTALILAPTGSGKTLAAFLAAIDRLMFEPPPAKARRCRVLYVSPLKALAVDVERNLRAPLVGVSRYAERLDHDFYTPRVAIRTGDTPMRERAQFMREPDDILITTPESLYLLLTSNAREALRSVRTVIVDEIHTMVGSKRGAHLALSLERLEALTAVPLQRIGLSATVRPAEEAARFLGGFVLVERGAWSVERPEPDLTEAHGHEAPALSADTSAPDPGSDAPTLPAPRSTVARPVAVVDAGARKEFDLTVEVAVEDMAKLGQVEEIPSGPAAQAERRTSIWPAIHPLLLRLIRAHRSTLIFVNSRRLAERLAQALNELAEEELVRAHHGSIAREQRLQIEDALKAGHLPALVATSSLELGIDMGAIDLVVQVEAPPSVASGIQRIGRAGHSIGLPSKGVILPKYRGDLLACAALTERMRNGAVEPQRYPRNPLDVLAQQIVGMVATEDWRLDELEALLRRAAPFAELPRSTLEGVLDMLSGRYPSDLFAELRPRLTWDRLAGTLRAREGARRIAVTSSGSIPDRGLYGVYLVGGEEMTGSSRRAPSLRVGELDEEMVFETRVGETFILGASTWRVEEITHDRVLVSPAPGVPGKMPFWKGDPAGRPLEFGQAVGALSRRLRELMAGVGGAHHGDTETRRGTAGSGQQSAVSPPGAETPPRIGGAGGPNVHTHTPTHPHTHTSTWPQATRYLMEEHSLTEGAARNLLQYLQDQVEAAGAVPDDRTIVVERYMDEMGDWRVCILSPFGSKVHAPWAMAIEAMVRERTELEVEVLWMDDGIVVRFPEAEEPPPAEAVIPDPDEVEELVLRQLGKTAVFAGRFREAAGRALLFPRRYPGQRAPLWQQRRKAADLLRAASEFPSFPIILEAYRECLRDVFDMPALVELLRDVRRRTVRTVTVTSRVPSPFAASLLFNYVASFMYEGDAPIAERRAQALTVDQAQLRELLGEVELRELLDPDALEALELQLQHLTEDRKARHPDALHDLLIRLGDLTEEEVLARCERAGEQPAVSSQQSVASAPPAVVSPQDWGGYPRSGSGTHGVGGGAEPNAAHLWLADLQRQRRVVPLPIAGETRYIAAEDMGRYRDALGIPPPPGLPAAFLEFVRDPVGELVSRYARTHGPFRAEEVARRFGMGLTPVTAALHALEASGRVVQGEFRPGGSGREWCDAGVLRTLRQKSLARLRREVEPVEQAALGRLYVAWQGVASPRRGADALLEVIEQLQGAAIPISDLETRVLPARIQDYDPRELDMLTASGAVLWVGREPLGERDGRVSLYLAVHAPLLVERGAEEREGGGAGGPNAERRTPLHARIREHLAARGASFFPQLLQACGDGFQQDVIEALWDLVWAGEVTNDTLQPLRAYLNPRRRPKRLSGYRGLGMRSRALFPPEVSGRWSLVSSLLYARQTPTEQLAARTRQLLDRFGILTREAVQAEEVEGGFSALYPVLRRMEEAGHVRRGYFVSGRGATQFALPGAVDRLRGLREPPEEPQTVLLAADDPANPYGAALPWPSVVERGAWSVERPDSEGPHPNAERRTPPLDASRSTLHAPRERRAARAAGAIVILVDGALAAWMGRGERGLLAFLDGCGERGPQEVALEVARALASQVGPRGRRALFVREVNGRPAQESPMAAALADTGFTFGLHGYMKRL